jgi:hypothetical protein
MVALFVAMAILAVSCAGSPAPTATSTPTATIAISTPVVTPSPSPTPVGGLQTFTSANYGYTVKVPASWWIRDALQPLTDGEFPEDSGLATDKFTEHQATDTYPFLTISAQPVPAGYSPAKWAAFTVQVAYPHIGCKPARQQSIKVGPEPGTLFIYECSLPDYVLWAAAVHGILGFHFALSSSAGHTEAADVTFLERLLGSLTFVR